MLKPPAVLFSDVSFSYSDKVILDSVELAIQPGSVTVLMGGSGSGKTTLLKLITGALQPKSGHVQVLGQHIKETSQTKLHLLRRQIGYLFQHNALFTDLTVAENVAFPLLELGHVPLPIIDITVRLKLAAVDLLAARQLYPYELSGGMARRAALARALALDPQLVLFDEPFAGQDPITTAMLIHLIKKLNSALHLTSIIVSHEVNAAMQLADTIYLLHQRKLISGTPDALRQSTEPVIRHFFDNASYQPEPNEMLSMDSFFEEPFLQ